MLWLKVSDFTGNCFEFDKANLAQCPGFIYIPYNRQVNLYLFQLTALEVATILKYVYICYLMYH